MTPSHGAPFRGFRDDSESPFFCAPGQTPEATWDISIDRLARLLVKLGPVAKSGAIEMSAELLCSWHREIFGELFPEDAGRLRGRHEGRWEHVQYGGYVGTRRSRRIRVYRGAHPRRLHRRLEKICAEFNTTAAEIRASPDTDSFDAAHAATRLYVKVLRAHPFVDGNLRACIVALNAGLVMFGLGIVTFKDLERHDELLGVAFVGKHDPYRTLAQHIVEIVGDSESD
ncbi:MAG TPA: Fic family protein [Solirubrobacteraceae bacterium]|nr:Fic family protein [Solirubrobacteraceae bacterium]